jgi:hypothetical protein
MKEKLDYIKAAQSAKIGIWKFNLQTNDVFWDDVKCIHEVPIDYEPELDTAVNFYTPGKNRDRIRLRWRNQ